MTSVFVSYSRHDKVFVEQLVKELEGRNSDVWVDWEGIPPTAEWLNEVYAAIESRDAFIFVLSAASVASRRCLDELARAAERNKRLIPLVWHEVDEAAVPEALVSKNWILFSVSDRDSPSFQESAARVTSALETDLDWLHAHTRLLVRAREWDQKERNDSLVLRGGELAEFEKQLARFGGTLGELQPTDLQRAYVQASRASAKRRRVTLLSAVVGSLLVLVILGGVALVQRTESQLAAVSADQARATAVAQSEARATADTDARLNATAEALASQRADQEQTVKTSQRLAASAENQLAGAADTALLLAYEAAVLDHNQSTEQALRDALERVPLSPSVVAEQTDQALGDLSFSADGKHMLLLAGDTSQLKEVSGQTVASLPGSASFTPDGQLVIVSGQKSTSVYDLSGKELAALTGLLVSGGVSSDGNRILTSTGKVVTAWDLSGTEIARFQGNSVVLSPDGKHVFALAADNKGHLLDLAGGDIDLGADAQQAVFSPSSRSLLTSSNNRQLVTLWESGRTIATFDGYRGYFGGDGHTIVTTSATGTAYLWSTSGEQLAMFEGPIDKQTNAFEFSPDGEHILTSNGASASVDSPRLWDRNGKLLATFEGKLAEMSPDGRRILTSDRAGTATVLWDSTGRKLATIDKVWGRFSPDGRFIATHSDAGLLQLWDLGAYPFTVFRVGVERVQTAVVSMDGRLVLTSTSGDDRNPVTRLWDDHAKQLAMVTGSHAVFSPSGRQILTVSGDIGWLWDLQGTKLATFVGASYAAAFSPTGEHILTSGRAGVRLSDLQDNQVAHFDGDQPVFSPAGGVILTMRPDDNTATLWDLLGAPIGTLGGPATKVKLGDPRTTMTFSPDGQRVAAWLGNTAWLMDLTGNELARFVAGGTLFRIDRVQYSRDGQRVLIAGAEDTLVGRRNPSVGLWRSSGERIAQFDGGTFGQFGPDGSILTDGGAVWDTDGRLRSTLRFGDRDQTHVVDAAFSSDNHRAIVVSDDGTARQYLLGLDDLLAVAVCHVTRRLTSEEVSYYQVPQPLKLDFDHRHCPPNFSWELAATS